MRGAARVGKEGAWVCGWVGGWVEVRVRPARHQRVVTGMRDVLVELCACAQVSLSHAA